MNLVERLKPSGERSQFKIIRAFRHYKYIWLSILANYLVTKVQPGFDKEKNKQNAGERIIISLTSFPARINTVHLAIKSILCQTIIPDKIILWLSKEQFPNWEIPDSLNKLKQYGLEIKFCNDDLRAHKKYFYALQSLGPSDILITIDDDIIYHPQTIERLIKKHTEVPQSIIVSQAHKILYDENGDILKYRDWPGYKAGMKNPDPDFMPLTGSGCLYPPGIMPNILFDKDMIKNLAFTADDLWVGWIARYYGVPITVVDKPANIFTVINSSQSVHLGEINCINGGNDKIINLLFNYFNTTK